MLPVVIEVEKPLLSSVIIHSDVEHDTNTGLVEGEDVGDLEGEGGFLLCIRKGHPSLIAIENDCVHNGPSLFVT